jgi:hypothetical protein
VHASLRACACGCCSMPLRLQVPVPLPFAPHPPVPVLKRAETLRDSIHPTTSHIIHQGRPQFRPTTAPTLRNQQYRIRRYPAWQHKPRTHQQVRDFTQPAPSHTQSPLVNMPPFVGAIDQGTTSSRFIIFDTQGSPVASHQIEFNQIYPNPGYDSKLQDIR